MIDEDFDDEYASPEQWARFYRKAGLQVVPALRASDVKAGSGWKRPAIKWAHLEGQLIDDDQFEAWYGYGGRFAGRANMGLITGDCSSGAFIVDLDTHRQPYANIWWQGIHEDNVGGIILETPTQTTGGGGKQYLFYAPEGWVPPTIKTAKGIDIRGKGGFAMLPPSMHESGRPYQWDDGLSPQDVPIMVAPRWLCDEIDRLVVENGGTLAGRDFFTEKTHPEIGGSFLQGNNSAISLPAPHGIVSNDFGLIVDGREAHMARMVFGRLVDEYRKDPTPPTVDRQKAIAVDLFHQYVASVKSRLRDETRNKVDLLEAEGRGGTLFMSKFFDLVKKWNTKVKDAAMIAPRQRSDYREPAPQKPLPSDPDESWDSGEKTSSWEEEFSVSKEFSSAQNDCFSLLSIEEIFNLPDPSYLVKDVFIENGLYFLYGAPGCGKTFIALDLALTLATSRASWWGNDVEKAGPVLYISSEGTSDMKFRIKAWAETTGASVHGLDFRLAHETMNFMDENDVTKLCRSVDGWISSMGGKKPILIVVDTVSRVLPGADENLQKDMTIFVRACDRLRGFTGCAVMGVHHTPKNSDNMRGSTVLLGAADTACFVMKPHNEMEGTVTAMKIKTAPSGWSWDFRMSVTPLVCGHSSLIAERIVEPSLASPEAFKEGFGGKQETAMIRLGPKLWREDLIFAVLNTLQNDFEAGRGWTWSKNTPRWYASNMKLKLGISYDDAKVIIDELYAMNAIIVRKEGSSRNMSYALAEKAPPGFVRTVTN